MKFHSLALAMTALWAMQASAELYINSPTQNTNIIPKTAVPAQQATPSPFVDCTKIGNDAARLACYDELAGVQDPQKRQVHLTNTLKNAITGNLEVVYGDVQGEPVVAGVEGSYKDNVVISTNDSKVLTEFGKSKDALKVQSPLSLAYDLDKNSERGLWTARPHNANYILPLYFNTHPNRHPSTPTQEVEDYSINKMRIPELKFQLSLKAKAAENVFGTDADLWLGYTQLSHWQVYNEDNSRPFRAHDYEPEVFLTQPVVAKLPFGGKLRMLGAGAVHHSNGESDPLSRSWNRIYLMGGAEWGRLTIMPRLWTRVTQKDGSKPDDNPDISSYYGYGDVKFLYQLQDNTNLSGLVRLSPKTGKGAVQIDYVKPLGKGVSGYLQFFHGYGQSLIDYNHEATSFGVGIMLNDWLGL